MIDRSNFTAEEWSKIRGSVLGAGMVVSMAEPSGLIGMMKEGFANVRSMLEAKQDANANALVKAVIDDLATAEGRSAARDDISALVKNKQPQEIRTLLLSMLTDVGQIIDAKAPNDASGFKLWLKDNSRKVAEAASEGGILGFGGTRVTDNERAAIQHIDRVLN